MNLPGQADVVIIGAGPAGLMAAAQLLRYGVQPVIIDSKTGPVNESRAIAIQARSLEMLRQLGAAKTFLKEGNRVKCVAFHESIKEIKSFEFSKTGQEETEFPFTLIIEQSKTERILLDVLTANACPVFWNTELLNLSQKENDATLTVNTSGICKALTTAWVIGADGPESKVRTSLGINFVEAYKKRRYYLADLALNNLEEDKTVRVFLDKAGFTGIYPLPNNLTRFIGILPKSLKNKTELSFDDIKPYLTYNFDLTASTEQCNWFSGYNVQAGTAEKFQVKNCFLIGEAAEVHLPVTGEGINAGFQNAYNLAWKLAGVIKGEFDASILRTYANERLPQAKQSLKITHRLIALLETQNHLFRLLGRLLFFWVWKKPLTAANTFKYFSQISISYPESSLSVHHSLATKIKAGDRLPYLKVFDEKLKAETNLHEWCKKPGFTLLVIGKLNQRDLLALVKWIKLTYSFQLNFFYLPPSPRNRHIFECFEIPEAKKKAIVVRPDLHIGYINDVVDVELLDGYFWEAVRIKKINPDTSQRQGST